MAGIRPKFRHSSIVAWASQVVLMIKNLPTNAEDIIEEDFIPDQEDSLEEGM